MTKSRKSANNPKHKATLNNKLYRKSSKRSISKSSSQYSILNPKYKQKFNRVFNKRRINLQLLKLHFKNLPAKIIKLHKQSLMFVFQKPYHSNKKFQVPNSSQKPHQSLLQSNFCNQTLLSCSLVLRLYCPTRLYVLRTTQRE